MLSRFHSLTHFQQLTEQNLPSTNISGILLPFFVSSIPKKFQDTLLLSSFSSKNRHTNQKRSSCLTNTDKITKYMVTKGNLEVINHKLLQVRIKIMNNYISIKQTYRIFYMIQKIAAREDILKFRSKERHRQIYWSSIQDL